MIKKIFNLMESLVTNLSAFHLARRHFETPMSEAYSRITKGVVKQIRGKPPTRTHSCLNLMISTLFDMWLKR